MNNLYFWKDWDGPYRKLYWVVFLLFIVSIIYCFYQFFYGIDSVIHWEVVSKLEQLKTTAHSVNIGNYLYSFPLDNYIVTQYYKGSDLSINPVYAYIFLASVVLSVNLVMSLVSSMSKIWFYVSMAGFMGFVVLLNLDQIMLFGKSDKSALIIILATYLPASYYFKEINQRIGIFTRFAIFMIISVIIGALFYQFAGVNNPFLHIANHGIYGPLIISVLYIIFVAHEIIFAFLYLITNSNSQKSRNSLLHFSVISSFYLLYVILTFLKFTNKIDWDLIYLNPYLLGLVTIILGIWGYRRREHLFAEIFNSLYVGPLFYLSFGILTIATISYFFSINNDPYIETIEDAILYSQIGFGIMFFMYVIVNFSPLLAKNLQVSKIVYQSRGLPFFTFRLGGIIAVGFMLYDAAFFPYYQSIAGYYNNVGDLYLVEENYDLAKEYYTEGAVYEFQNHRSNYGLATIARKQKDIASEAYYFENAMLKRPSEFAYVNLSNVYLNNNQYFEGLFQLKEGERNFPKSSHILNNLGYFYSKTDIADSAYFYYDIAYLNKGDRAVPASNIFGLFAKSGVDISLDSLEEKYKTNKNNGGEANKLAMHNQFNLSISTDRKQLEISSFDYSQANFALLYNFGLSSIKSADTLYFNELEAFCDSSKNEYFINRSKILKALNLYFTHQVTLSLFELYQLGDVSMFNDEYFNILGQLAMELHSPELAVDYFRRTSYEIIDSYAMNLAIAEMETGNLDTARVMLEGLSGSENRYISKQAIEYLEVLNWKPDTESNNYSDEFKYMLLRDRNNILRSDQKDLLLSSIKDKKIKALATIDLIEKLLAAKDIVTAEKHINALDGIKEDSELASRLEKIRYLLVLDGIKDNTLIPDPGSLPLNDPNYLYDLLIELDLENSERDTIEMDQKFKRLAEWDMFFERGVIAAVDYFYNKRDKENYAYNLLVNALNINAYSFELNDYYIDFCISTDLLDNAADRLNIMRRFMNESDFLPYYSAKNIKIKEREVEIENWWQ